MKEQEILELITSEYTWEQVIYKIIGWEGMDPWNLDISLLSRSFVGYMAKLEELDFNVPAKYIIIAAVLLRMKSEHLEYVERLVYGEQDMDSLEDHMESEVIRPEAARAPPELGPIAVPARRQPTRRIAAEELISALRAALRTQERRDSREEIQKKAIQIREDTVTRMIDKLYERIGEIISGLRSEEVAFSRVVDSWTREGVVSSFLPLMHLEQQKRVRCRQEKLFDEIFIKRGGDAAGRPEPVRAKGRQPDGNPPSGKRVRGRMAARPARPAGKDIKGKKENKP
jgi:segregation and condensation protein A